MNEDALVEYLNKDYKSLSKFYGIFSIDELNFDIPNKSGYLICNTDESYNTGKHWVVIFFNKNIKQVEYFDSLGRRPSERLINFMRQDNHYILYNTKKIQSSLSDSCGLFCLYLIYFMCRNLDYKSIIDNFSLSVYDNEKHVKKFIKQTFKQIFI